MITITLHGYKVPSLNALFAMNHWQRRKEKQKAQAAFMSALRHSAQGSLTPITSPQNFWSIAADTLASSLMIRQKKSSIRAAKSNAQRKKRKLF